jgi:hypothetical protein
MMKPNKFKIQILQDTVLLILGTVFLVLTFSNLLGINGILTLLIGCSFLGFSAVDVMKTVMKPVADVQ